MDSNIAFPLGGYAAGAGIYSTVGGVGIGFIGLTTAATVVGSAIYGAVQGINNEDSTAFAAMGLGAACGAGIYSTVGGIGVGFAGSAFGLGLGSMTAVGGIFGLGIYGLAKMFAGFETKESVADVFDRMDDQISYTEAYCQAMMELNPLFQDLLWKQQFSELEIEQELELLKAQLEEKSVNSNDCKNKNFYTELNWEELKVSEKLIWRSHNILLGHLNNINSFAIKNNILASASDDKTVSLWNIATGKQIYTFSESQEVLDVAINDRIVVAGGFNKRITSWKLQDKSLDSTFSNSKFLYGRDSVIYALVFNHKGDNIISAGADKTIEVWNAITGSLKYSLNGHTDLITTLAISPCDRFLISGSADGKINLWDLLNPSGAPKIVEGHSSRIAAIKITPDGNYFISSSQDKTVLWCMKNLEVVILRSQNADSIAISPDSKIVAFGNYNKIWLWDLATKEIVQTLDGCSPVIFSEDGEYLITADRRDRINIWQKNSQSNLDLNLLGREWWEILNVRKNSSYKEVKSAYYALAKKHHPDIDRSQKAKVLMSTINQAYQQYKKGILYKR